MKNKKRIQAVYTKLKVRRWIAFLLCAALVGCMVRTALPALAVNDDGEETYEDETLCKHHPAHTEECGYVEAVEGQPCTHEHDENCGYTEAAEGQFCTHEHDGECDYVTEQPCTHEHDESCGYVKAVEAAEGQECNHEHDESCGEEEQDCTHVHNDECGYVKAVTAVEGQECNHEHDENCGYAEEQLCNHVHGEECGYEEGQPCTHEHDEECGYVEAVEGQPCQFVCEICGGGSEEAELTAVMSAAGPRIVQEEGLIAYFNFDDSNNRLRDYSGKGAHASLHTLEKWVPDVKGEVSNVDDYFDDIEPGALHLNDDACLVLDEGDYFNDMTELTVEMRIKILHREEEASAEFGGDANWLFYAEQPAGISSNDRALGVSLTRNKLLRILRQNGDEVNSGIFDNQEFPPEMTDEEKKEKKNQFSEAGFSFKEGEWYTVRIIYKPSNMALYVNGNRIVDRGLGNKTSDYFKQGQHLWFGHSAFSGDSNFMGYMDEIKVYNYANYYVNCNDSGDGYLDGYIDEQQHIITEGVVDPPYTTVHMFDYWIDEDGGQVANDFDPFDPPLSVNDVRSQGINQDHLLLFAGWNASTEGPSQPGHRNPRSRYINSSANVGSWNCYAYNNPDTDNHRNYEPFPGIVNSVLDNGYPRLAIDKLKDEGFFYDGVDQSWYNGKDTEESLAYLFDPNKDNKDKGGGKVSYPNVTGLFRLKDDGTDTYYFSCEETFAELNREQNRRPKESTGNNKITLYQRSSKYLDFFPFNDATDLFYIQLKEDGTEGALDKANGTNMEMQSTTDEPFNHYLGMTVETSFAQPTDGMIDLPNGGTQPMKFYFSGDDDVWIFIDDVLVADLGGLHQQLDVNIDFSTGIIEFTGHDEGKEMPLDGTDGRKPFDTTLREMFEKAYDDNSIKWDENEWNENNPKLFADGSKHTLKFFYLERGNAASRCTIEFNLQNVEPDLPADKPSKKDKTHEERLPEGEGTPEEQWSEEIVTLNVSADVPKENGDAVPAGVLASPNTGDSNLVGLWFALLALSTAGIIGVYRTRRHGNK